MPRDGRSLTHQHQFRQPTHFGQTPILTPSATKVLQPHKSTRWGSDHRSFPGAPGASGLYSSPWISSLQWVISDLHDGRCLLCPLSLWSFVKATMGCSYKQVTCGWERGWWGSRRGDEVLEGTGRGQRLLAQSRPTAEGQSSRVVCLTEWAHTIVAQSRVRSLQGACCWSWCLHQLA